jgi:predicted AlkP superfamily pyrophosphatase or phosphodiesterase
MKHLLLVIICVLSTPYLSSYVFAAKSVKPKLILQITVDQLRGDLPNRYKNRFGKGGFRYLFDKGIYYSNAHFQHANTETIVGHTTLATGAHPAAHGMVGNVWFDRETGSLTYNIEDSRYPLLSAGAGVDKKTEIDPTQRTAKTEGRSPQAILVSTISDELAVHYAGRAKIFGVSVKDRGAVSMAGHAGKAFWFSKKTGEFVTSRYYYDEYPDWAKQWNRQRRAFDYENTAWELLNDRGSYVFGDADERKYETDFPGFGRTFPHPYGATDNKYYTTLLTLSPAGDELVLDFAKTLIVSEQLGKDDIPDYLAVSFSSTDYVGHIFGPSSLESEDNLLRLDRTLAMLLSFIDKQIGLRNTLLVVSADHGAPEVPGYLQSLGIFGGYVDPKSWEKQAAFERLKAKFGIGEELIETYFHPYLYLNRDVIKSRGLNQREIEQAIAEEISRFKGVALAISSSDLRTNSVPDMPLLRSVLNNFHPKRSGDIFVVFEPHWFINDFDGLTVASTHGSPWSYDTYVPIFFAGNGLKAMTIARPVGPHDVAPTIANYLQIKPPSGSVNIPLAEVVSQ